MKVLIEVEVSRIEGPPVGVDAVGSFFVRKITEDKRVTLGGERSVYGVMKATVIRDERPSI